MRGGKKWSYFLLFVVVFIIIIIITAFFVFVIYDHVVKRKLMTSSKDALCP